MPVTGSWSIGPRIAGAAALAVEEVNADTSLFPGRVLEYSWADSGCSPKQGLVAMGKLLGLREISAVIGPACSSACEVTSFLSSGYEIPQISWGCTSPTLSNKNEYGLVCPAESMHTQSLACHRTAMLCFRSSFAYLLFSVWVVLAVLTDNCTVDRKGARTNCSHASIQLGQDGHTH